MNKWYGRADWSRGVDGKVTYETRVVPRTLCSLSGIARPGKHENALLHQCHPWRVCRGSALILRLEVLAQLFGYLGVP